jgi:7-cyano-7-deazaguanine reductase
MTHPEKLMTVLGKTVTGPLDVDEIEWWPLPNNITEASVEGSELQAVCPVTGQPDLYDFVLVFHGDTEPESKSLKLYLLSFRDRGISCADLASTLAQELTEWGSGPVEVHLTQQTRGGMRLNASATGTT